MGLAALQSCWRLLIPIGSPPTLAGMARKRWTGEGRETAYTSTGLLIDHRIRQVTVSHMENRANCRSCGGNIAFGRCLNCGVYPPKRRWWIVPALVIITLAVLGSALQGGGRHHVVTLASFFASDW
jgi:hypothetical protein